MPETRGTNGVRTALPPEPIETIPEAAMVPSNSATAAQKTSIHDADTVVFRPTLGPSDVGNLADLRDFEWTSDSEEWSL